MKKFKILLFAIFGIMNSINAQIKLFDDGYVCIGSVNKTYGINVDSDGFTWFNKQSQGNYSWLNLTKVRNVLSKSYVVDYYGTHKFYVFGDGTIYTPKVRTLADASSKENVKALEGSLDKIMKLRGVSFNYKKSEHERNNNQVTTDNNKDLISPEIAKVLEKERERKSIGLIAQEVELVVPEVVRTTTDGAKSIAYQEIIGLLVEGMKEQQALISDLQVEVENLKSSVSVTNVSSYFGETKLYQNTPNPFKENTEIKVNIDNSIGNAILFIYDMQGKQIKSIAINQKGESSITIFGSELEAGMYYYALVVDGKEVETKKMILTE